VANLTKQALSQNQILANLNTLYNDFQAGIGQVRTIISQVQEAYNQLQSSLNSVNSVISNIVSSISSVGSYMAGTFQSIQANITLQISSLNSHIVALNATYNATVTNITKTINAQIQTLQTQIQQLQKVTPISSVQNNITQLQTQIQTLNASLNAQVANLTQSLNASVSNLTLLINGQYSLAYQEMQNQMKSWVNGIGGFANSLSSQLIQIAGLNSTATANLQSLNQTLSNNSAQLALRSNQTTAALISTQAQITSDIAHSLTQIANYSKAYNQIQSFISSANSTIASFQNMLSLNQSQIEQNVAVLKQQATQSLTAVNNSLLTCTAQARPALLAQQQSLMYQIGNMTVGSLYMIYSNCTNYTSILTLGQSMMTGVVSMLTNVTTQLSSDIANFTTTVTNMTANITNVINPLINSTTSLLSQLQQNITATNFSIYNDSQVAGYVNQLTSLNITLLTASLNVTNLTAIYQSAQAFYNQTVVAFTQLNGTYTAIMNGTFNWTSLLNQTNLLNIQQNLTSIITDTVSSIVNTTRTFRALVQSSISGFQNQSNTFLASSSNTSNSMTTTGNNIQTLSQTTTPTSGANLFDFSVFNLLVSNVTSVFNQLQNTAKSLNTLVSSNLTTQLQQLKNIVDPNYWTQVFNNVIGQLQTVQNKFKIFLNVGSIQAAITSSIQVNLSSEVTAAVNLLNCSSIINSVTSNFNANSLLSITNTKSFVSTIINIFGPSVYTTKNLFLLQENPPPENFPPIPTPIGEIVVSVSFGATARMDMSMQFSMTLAEFGIIPAASLSANAGGAWNFVLGQVGAGVRIASSASLPAKVGYDIMNSFFYIKGTLQFTNTGTAGIFVQWLVPSICYWCLRICFWRCRCLHIPYPCFYYSSPNYIISVSLSDNISNDVIPYQQLSLNL
jgi:predicted  nucleic acid-binding Zn-ribbon protein